MKAAEGDVKLLALRATWWGAAALLVLHVVVWPEMLAQPATRVGSKDAASANLQWIAIALVVWLVVGSRLIDDRRSAPVGGAQQRLRGLASGSAALLLMILMLGAAVLIISLLARGIGALLT